MALTNHIVSDSPTNNFATLNPLSTAGSTATPITISDGNLKTVHSVTGQWQGAKGTISVSSGIWYFEVVILQVPTGTTQNYNIGFYNADIHNDLYYLLAGNLTFGAYGDVAQLFVNTSNTAYGSLGSNGSIYMFCLDVDSEKFWVGLNGSWFASGNPSTGVNPSASGFGKANWTTVQSDYTYSGAGSFQHNYGQDPTFGGAKSPTTTYTDANGLGAFYYQPPTDALALCTANLPEMTPDVAGDVPQEYFKAVTYTGNGTGQSITSVGFQPDLVWIKRRSANENHWLTDSVRGVTKGILSNLTDAEATRTDQIQSFDTDGFTLGNDGAGYTNASTQLYVSWCWKAGGAPTADNTATSGAMTANSVSLNGTLQSNYTPAGSPTIYPKRMSINTNAGFSIVSWESTSTITDTVAHGLNQTPEVVIWKDRDSENNWFYITNTVDGSWDYLSLNLPSSKTDYADASATATTIKNFYADGGKSIIAYCWHSVEGYSKFGSYTANNSDDGNFVYLEFRPSFVMIKATGGSSNSGYWSWTIYDNARKDYNPAHSPLYANLSVPENYRGDGTTSSGGDTLYLDFLSNGFKIRNSGTEINGVTTNYIFMAFAEQPFKYANAR